MDYDEIVVKTADTLVLASTRFRKDQEEAFQRIIDAETNPAAAWVLRTLLENAQCAHENKSPLCDDTGIPHVILEIGKNRGISPNMLHAINDGIALGLKNLPGRPMAVKGDDLHRLDQSQGLEVDPEAVVPPPYSIVSGADDILRLHILMQGGGPEIRAKTYRVFHKHRVGSIIDDIVEWASESVGLLGCTPCTLAVGIGRSHFEAASFMLQAMAFGDFSKQNEIEKEITTRVNNTGVGPLGIGGKNTVLATFAVIGPQRASGVRIVCMRPCCCMEPRVAMCEL
jgi:fumarate hydratase subunit alpha